MQTPGLEPRGEHASLCRPYHRSLSNWFRFNRLQQNTRLLFETLLGGALLLGAAATPARAAITVQPASQVVSLNAHVALTVTATTTAPPITYQWWGLGTLLPGETNRTCTISNIQPAQAGDYHVVVNDAANQPVQSDTATISVNPTFIKKTEGPLVTDAEETETSLWWDYDNDGDLDVLVQVGAPFGTGGLQSFYRNDGDGVFTKVTTNAVAASRKRAQGAVAGDIDNDGDLDLYVGSNAWQSNDPKDDLFLNHGNGLFAVVTGGSWSQDLDHSFDCTFVDINRDGLLDIFVHNYDQPGRVYRQTVAGAFIKVTASEVGSLLGNPGPSYSATWVDYDNDGDLDLWTESAQGGSRLHQNDGHGFFTLATPTSFAQAPGGIGVWADFDNDGFPELFVGGATEGGDRPNALFRGVAAQNFENVAVAAGVAQSVSAWVPSVGDYDNDGWLDIFACYWYQGAANAARTNVMFHNRGDGTFETVEVGSPIRDGQDLRCGSRWVDYDNDGFLDLFLTCGTADATTRYPRLNHLFRNNGPAIGNTNHWLKLKLNGQAANRSGIGAKIRVKATLGGREIWQVRELTGNGWSETCPGLIAHFGLGDATKADVVRVEWPSGNAQELTDVPAGQAGQAALTITEQVFITPVRPSSSLSGSVTLTSSRTGATARQWYHDGAAIDGQTGQTLALSGISTNDAGRYSVVVTAATGTFTNYVYLLVDTQFEQITSGDVVRDGMRANQGAWGDYDGDGRPDLAVTGGYWDTSGAINSALYHNDGAGQLIKVADSPLSTSRDRACYLAWADFDNDGDLDLGTGVQESALTALYLNQGNSQFIKQRTSNDWIANGIAVRGSTLGWGDYDADGLLDLMVINWVAGGGVTGPDSLLHNVGDGRLEVMTNSALALRGTSEETVAWVDYDGDGDLDFSSVESDSAQLRRLFRNLGNGSFEPVNDSPFWGEKLNYWGHVWADFDNDGDFDVIVCASAANASRDAVFLNDGQGNLVRADLAALGLAADFGSLPVLGDYDNDGYLDLYCSGAEGRRNRLYHNRGDGTFDEVLVGSIPNFSGPSALGGWADYDGDGYLDLFVPNDSQQNDLLYRNNHREYLAQLGRTNHWLQINPRGTKSNRSGIGAKVFVTATIGGKTVRQLRQIGGQTCAPELFAHFGLGNATKATTVRIEWPSGAVQELSNVSANQVLTLWEPPVLRAAGLPDGSCTLTITAEPNRAWRIEASTDLATWQLLTTLTPTDRTFVFTDTAASGMVCRFYRVESAP